MKHYESVGEITSDFIKEGWSNDTLFTELSREEAEAKGYLFAIHGMYNGRKYFVMNGNGNIFDDTGKIVLFNIDTKK